ncbi:MAG: hypothetical protein Q9227_004595 [Pyrenula ochraceoflavens]
MSSPEVRPYGTWDSPISADLFEVGGAELDGVIVNESNGKLYLIGAPSDQNGRSAVVEFSDAGSRDVLPKEYSAATRVHEYGGTPCAVNPVTGHIVFADFESNAVFDLDPDTSTVKPIVEKDERNYFADFDIHPKSPKWVIAIKEDHHSEVIDEIINTLIAIDSSTSKVTTIAQGADFYTYPRFSPDGTTICWTQWNHPDMPWYETELWLADWDEGTVKNARKIVGDKQESITQPRWGLDGSLFYASNRSGFWQLYQRHGEEETKYIHIKGLEEAEFAHPDWCLGASWYQQLTPTTLVAFYSKEGSHTGIIIDLPTCTFTDPHWPITEILAFESVKRISSTTVAIIGSTPTSPLTLYTANISNPSSSPLTLLRSSLNLPIPSTHIPPTHFYKFPRTHPPTASGSAYCLFKPPTNTSFTPPPSSPPPPLILALHGGPTHAELTGFSLRDAYWTSRGYAVAQVNYAGSSGYGRTYIRQLDTQMGVSDIGDAASAIDFLSSRGLVDRSRVGVTGHSAGGYCTLQALTNYPSLYRAGVAESSISELDVLFKEIHKFESRYLHRLCFAPGASAEERARVTRERSALYKADRVKAPLLMTHGREDKIVPRNQPEMMAEGIRKGGGVVKVLVYPDEGHVLRDGKHVRDSVVETERWWREYLL